MSIDNRLAEIQRAINQARGYLDCVEALVVEAERPSLEMLARVAAMIIESCDHEFAGDALGMNIKCRKCGAKGPIG